MRTWLLLLAVLAADASAQTYRAGRPYRQLVSVGATGTCESTVYDPDVVALPDGRLVMWGQGADLESACNRGIDSLYAVGRDRNGIWANPAPAAACPSITGKALCQHYSGGPHSIGPLASPSVIQVGERYYMAYVGGNADMERGRIQWAVSNDGETWAIHGGADDPQALLTPAGPTHTACERHGVGQVQLAYENGFFYFFLSYFHFTAEHGGPFSHMAYRIAHDPNDPFGLGERRELYSGWGNKWIPHDGRLRFIYEGGTIPVRYGYELRGYDFGQGDLEWDPERQRWIHVYGDWPLDALYWQEAASLADGRWTPRRPIDTRELTDRFPGAPIFGPSIWWGDVTDDGAQNPRWYLFAPVQPSFCAFSPFAGVSIAVMPLEF